VNSKTLVSPGESERSVSATRNDLIDVGEGRGSSGWWCCSWTLFLRSILWILDEVGELGVEEEFRKRMVRSEPS
jgi:hypothetical protein